MTPVKIGRFAANHWRSAVLPVGVAATGGGAAHVESRHDHRKAAGVIAGSAAGEAAFRATGHGVKFYGKAQEHARPGQSRSQYQKLVSRHKEAHGMKGLQGDELRRAINRTPAYARTYPKELGGWQAKRIVGHMSGRRGKAIEAAAVIGGGAVGRRQASRDVSKGLIRDAGLVAVGAALGRRGLSMGPTARGVREGYAAAGQWNPWGARNVTHGALAPTVVHNANAVFTRMPTAAGPGVRNAAALGVTYHANRRR